MGSVAKVQLCSESMNWFVGQVQKGGKVRMGEKKWRRARIDGRGLGSTCLDPSKR